MCLWENCPFSAITLQLKLFSIRLSATHSDELNDQLAIAVVRLA